MESITIYTDGGCSGNPGPGGYAYIIRLQDRGGSNTVPHTTEEHRRAAVREIVGSGGEADTTNNRMELRAVIAALEEVERRAPGAKVVLYTDSQYVKNGISSWIATWKRNGWRTSDKKAVKNRELWEKLDAVASRVKPSFAWVRGHSGVEHNERCDALVQAEIRKFS